ncbi:MAG: AMP-binding protein [Betaproteobacteria bacterium]
MSEVALVRDFPPDAPVGWRGGAPVSLARFLSAVQALARTLPPRRFCVNACDDRLNFMLGFAAALVARSTNLLPQNRAPGHLRELAVGYEDIYCITDRDEPIGELECIRIGEWPCGSQPADIPVIDAEHQAVILFTSGSTGIPQPHAKSWRSLTQGAAATRKRVAIQPGSTLLGVVPPQHMWGFETTVMLPLQSGCAVDAGCPLLPAEINAALARLPRPRWLVATPAHLRACALSNERLPVLDGALCSTAPLSPELARSIEETCRAPVLEIFGSTETGVLATRRTSRTATFEVLEDIRLGSTEDGTVAQGGHLMGAVALSDVLALKDETAFTVQGRASDLIKVAGKRGSLAALNAELIRIPGVIDGVFWVPEEAQGERRLAAFAVAPGLSASEIIAHLKQRIDAVFLPRPLFLVEALPRNRAGKLTQESLRELAAAYRAPPRRTAHAVVPPQGVAAGHPAMAGHFPGNPVVPGAWLLEVIERAARERFGADLSVCGIPEARFRAVLRPEEAFSIVFEQLAENRLAFAVERENLRIADGTLLVRLVS